MSVAEFADAVRGMLESEDLDKLLKADMLGVRVEMCADALVEKFESLLLDGQHDELLQAVLGQCALSPDTLAFGFVFSLWPAVYYRVNVSRFVERVWVVVNNQHCVHRDCRDLILLQTQAAGLVPLFKAIQLYKKDADFIKRALIKRLDDGDTSSERAKADCVTRLFWEIDTHI